jgi:hypothetical protein
MKSNNKNAENNKTAKTKKESTDPDTLKYKYHQSQINEGTGGKEDYPAKPKNHTSTNDRLLNPDRGE